MSEKKESAVGDAAAMREALVRVRGWLERMNKERLDAFAESQITPAYAVNRQAKTIIEDNEYHIGQIDAALSAPPRNCDVGDADNWEKRFGEECDKGHTCSDCPVRHAKTRMAIEFDKGARCEFVWAQMPYEEGGAK